MYQGGDIARSWTWHLGMIVRGPNTNEAIRYRNVGQKTVRVNDEPSNSTLVVIREQDSIFYAVMSKQNITFHLIIHSSKTKRIRGERGEAQMMSE